MTERIFYTDVCCHTFQAAVLDCQPRKKKGYEVILDKTAFYPEGGGQPGDRGTLGGVHVTDTQERGGDIIHLTDAPLEVGAQVTGTLDWNWRFSLMQNHSGEHIVSGIIHRRTGGNNVGFHMGNDAIIIDFDKELAPELLQEVEQEANEIVWKNLPVQITYPSPEELEALDYRSKKALAGQVRIVTFPQADVCACCGTHVVRTGEIGVIKILSVQKFKEGSRVEMLCGSRALTYLRDVFEQNHRISVALSAKPLKTADAVERLKADKEQTDYRLNGLEQTLFQQKAEALTGAGDVILFEKSMAPDSVRKLSVAVMETCGGRCGVFSGDDESGYKYAIGQMEGDLRSWVKMLNQALQGRGGGKGSFVQGSVQAKRAEIQAFWDSQKG